MEVNIVNCAMSMIQSGITKTRKSTKLRLITPMCCSPPPTSATKTDQLRSQLDQLNSEALSTRRQASSARMRLMRLWEAAERLKRQAGVSVNSGKEEDARSLLLQKKKVMQAIYKTKARVEFLHHLSAKLNEAISLKESQLIGNIAVEYDIQEDDVSSPVRIISPKKGDLNGDDLRQDLEFYADGEARAAIDEEQFSPSVGIDDDEDTIIRGLKGISSYEDFLIHLDLQLNRMEVELVTVLNVSFLVIDSNEKHETSKVQQTMEILESIRAMRHRIAGILQKKG